MQDMEDNLQKASDQINYYFLMIGWYKEIKVLWLLDQKVAINFLIQAHLFHKTTIINTLQDLIKLQHSVSLQLKQQVLINPSSRYNLKTEVSHHSVNHNLITQISLRINKHLPKVFQKTCLSKRSNPYHSNWTSRISICNQFWSPANSSPKS
jgi:predicted DNA-binding protein (UPF0278 family)